MIVFDKYRNFANVFSPDLETQLLENMGINDYKIKIIDNLQLYYKLIYSLRFV